MIHLQPFRAVTPPETHARAATSAAPGAGRETLSTLLARWKSAGLLTLKGHAALHLVEAQVIGPQRELLPSPPVRFLLGKLPPDAELTPLEADAARALTEELEPVVSLVADPNGSFRGLLDEAATHAELVIESRIDGHLIRLSRIPPGAISKRLQSALDADSVRALVPPVRSDRQLGAFVSLAEPGLHLKPVHRAVRGWSMFDPETFLTLVGEYARVQPLATPLTTPEGIEEARQGLSAMAQGHHAMLAVMPGGRGVILRVRQGLDLDHIPAVPRNPTLRSLDLALLEALVLRTVLGIKDPEAAEHPNVIPVDQLEDLVEGVQNGLFQVGFALNPPPVWEVRAVMEAAATLPPRTLTIEPDLPSGLVFVDPH